MTHLLRPGDGEVLKLGPPMAGEVAIAVDPQGTAGAFAMGTQTLAPGAELPVHRCLAQEVVWFVHKGQGRAMLDGKAVTVVPGVTLVVPREVWRGLRNTGTGLLEFAWVSVPGGLEVFFRELSRLPTPLAPTMLEAVGIRMGIEFRTAGAGPGTGSAEAPGRHHPRRRGRGRRPERPTAPVAGPVAPAPAVILSPTGPSESVRSVEASTGPAASEPHRKRRHRRRGRRHPAGPSSQPATSATTAAGVPPARQAPSAGAGEAFPPRSAGKRTPAASASQRPARRPRDHGGRRRFGHVKEVYMGGRWIRVVGEGPVISTGHEASGKEPERS